MKNAIEMRERMAELAKEARSELDKINDKSTEAEAKEAESRFDSAMADHDKIEARLARQTKIDDAEKRASESESRVPKGQDTDARKQSEDKMPEYRDVFAKAICGQQDDLSTEERKVLRDGVAEFRAQTAGTTTAGGFTVPTTLANEIIKSMVAWGPMYDGNIVREIKTRSGNPMKIPTVNDTTTTTESHTEGNALTDDGGKDVTFGQKSLDAYAFDTEFVRWSWELDMDSIFNMEQLLAALLGERLGRGANGLLTNANGSSAPNGIVNASTLGKTAAATNAITFDEILDLEHSVDPAYRMSPMCRYMFNDSTLLAVRKLKDGQGNYLWQEGNVKDGTPAMFNGKPYSINQAMDSLATGQKPMIFGDFSKYYVRKVGDPVIGVLKERFWPDMGIAGLIRFDGELGDGEAVKHLITA